jgi:hypothetical protein
MSFLTGKSTQHHLAYNYLTDLKESISNLRINEYLSRRLIRTVPKDTKVREIEWFEEMPQGCLIYFKGKKEPIRGLMSIEAVNAATVWKRSIIMFLGFLQGSELYGFKSNNIFKKGAIFLSFVINLKFYIAFINSAIYDYTYDDPKKFSPPIRAIYDIFPEGLENERDVICFFLEADHAYKYRFQDIFSEINIREFRKNPLKEITRLLDIMIYRDSAGMKKKWMMLRKTLPMVYYYAKIFNRKLYKQIIKMVEELDIEKIKPTKEDIYWMNDMKSDYNFRGLSAESRKLLNT